MTLETDFDASKFNADIEKRKKRALRAYMSEWRRYAQPFVRKLSGKTDMSAFRSSQLDKGLVIYDTPYARYTYYNTDNKVTTDFHPNAKPKWGEVAWNRYNRQMLATAQKEFEK